MGGEGCSRRGFENYEIPYQGFLEVCTNEQVAAPNSIPTTSKRSADERKVADDIRRCRSLYQRERAQRERARKGSSRPGAYASAETKLVCSPEEQQQQQQQQQQLQGLEGDFEGKPTAK